MKNPYTPSENLTLDLDREARQGLPEVIYGPGKTPGEIASAAATLLAANDGPVLVTRVNAETAAQVLSAVPGGEYLDAARVVVWRPTPAGAFTLGVVTAGTADGPVASEAAGMASSIGMRVVEIRDVGVAGIDRIMKRVEDIRACDAVVVVAGMEGALASVVGGLVAAPVIAVPTSTGYGAALEGVTALLAMMTSCAAGVTVVNIDSGFGAAMAAHRLTRLPARQTQTP